MTDLSERLLDLAQRVARLSPTRHDPERFFMDKDEIARELRRIAQRRD